MPATTTLHKGTSPQYMFATQFLPGSEIRSLWATPSSSAPTIPRKFILCILYSYGPLHVYNNNKLHKDTSQQNSFTTKPPRESEIRSLWAINPRGAPTISRTAITTL